MHGSRLVAKAARGGNTGELIRNTTSPCGLVHIMLQHDTVSERLMRWTRNPLGSARRGSNPLGVVCDSRHMQTHRQLRQWRHCFKSNSAGSINKNSLQCVCNLERDVAQQMHQPGIGPGPHRWQRYILPLDNECDKC